MISEAQRRALFALREALHLCEVADVVVDTCSTVGLHHVVVEVNWVHRPSCLTAEHITRLLAEHPEQ